MMQMERDKEEDNKGARNDEGGNEESEDERENEDEMGQASVC